MPMNGIEDPIEDILKSSLTSSSLEIIGVYDLWNGALPDSGFQAFSSWTSHISDL